MTIIQGNYILYLAIIQGYFDEFNLTIPRSLLRGYLILLPPWRGKVGMRGLKSRTIVFRSPSPQSSPVEGEDEQHSTIDTAQLAARRFSATGIYNSLRVEVPYPA